MRDLYDNIQFGVSIEPQGVAATGTLNGAAVDTLGFNSAMFRLRIGVPSNNTTLGSILTTVKVQECATSGGTFTDALDNTGVAIGGNLLQVTTFVAGEIIGRIEGLGNLNRMRFLRLTETATFTAGAGSSIALAGEIVLGRVYSAPTNTAVSNT
jgi:hypothetical protein